MLDGRSFTRDASRNSAWHVWLVVFAIWSFMFALACRLLAMPENTKTARGAISAKLLGISRGEISDQFYGQADYVFHRGSGYIKPKARPDWFESMKRATAPAGHNHLHEDGILEIMPWLYFATRADPGNVTAYTVAAYWLAGEAGRPDLAEGVLDEAMRNNPSDYRGYMEKGRLTLKLGSYDKSARYFDRAIALVPNAAGPDQEEIRSDLAMMLTCRGLVYEKNGHIDQALRCYRETTLMFPGRTGLKERITDLENNGRAAIPPEKLIGIILLPRRHVCSEHEDG